MNLTVENVAACRKKLNIEVPVDEVSREWKGVLSEFQKFAQIPGFRAGKAPAAVLEKRYSKEIGEEVQRKLISQSFREAVAKEKLKVVSNPSLSDVKFGQNEPLRLTATVDVEPEFTLPNYKGLKAKKTAAEVKDTEVDDTLKMFAEQQASFSDVKDRALVLGDFAVISYTGTCDGKPISDLNASAKPLSENKQFWLLMAKDSFVPGFCEPLVGAKIGDKRDVSVTFPKDFRITELADKKADYSVEILGIKEKVLPTLDDAFAVTYKAANLQELKDKIKTNLQEGRKRDAEADLRNQLVDQLLKASSFELPESVVQAEIKNQMMDIIMENQRRGIEENTIREKSKDILDSAQKGAAEKVRAGYILARIAEQEKIQVKPEDIQSEIAAAAQQSRKSVQELTQNLEQSGRIDALREQLMIQKALDLIVSQAVLE